MYVLRALNRYAITYFLLALFTLFLITAWLIQPIASEEDYQNLLTVCGFIILFFCGLLLLIFAFKFNIHAQAKKAWLLIAIATFSWAFGELTELFFAFVLQTSAENQFIPDFLRLVGYPIFLLGLIMQWRIMEIQVKKLEAVIILALFCLSLIAVLAMLNIPIVLLDSNTIIESLILAIYPVMDLLLTFFSLVILWKVKRKKLVFPWIILTLLLVNNMVINWQAPEI